MIYVYPSTCADRRAPFDALPTHRPGNPSEWRREWTFRFMGIDGSLERQAPVRNLGNMKGMNGTT